MNDVVDGYMFEVTTTSGTTYHIVTRDNDMAVAIRLVENILSGKDLRETKNIEKAALKQMVYVERG